MRETTHIINGPTGNLELRVAIPDHWQAALPFVVCCHPHPLHGGSLTNKVVHTLAASLYKSGLAVVRFNFRGVGQSQGEFANAIGEQADVLAVVQWFRAQHPAAVCWLAGFSFGAYVAYAAHCAAQARVLLLVAPAVNLYDFSDSTCHTIPTLIIQGGQDEVVPPAQVQAWVSKQHKPPQLIWLDDAGHFFHGKLPLLHDAVTHFAQQLRS
jgi:hypothetical protein